MKNLSELNLVNWISSYNPQENGTCFFFFFFFFKLSFLYINIVGKITSVPSVWILIFLFTFQFFLQTTKLQSDRITMIDLLLRDQITQYDEGGGSDWRYDFDQGSQPMEEVPRHPSFQPEAAIWVRVKTVLCKRDRDETGIYIHPRSPWATYIIGAASVELYNWCFATRNSCITVCNI